jgi:SAM-dependent methyltransferase
MQDRHTDRTRYFREQEYTTLHHVIPFIQKDFPLNDKMHILEIGCGEGGNLKPFLDKGHRVTGIDISEGKINRARDYLGSPEYGNRIRLVANDIYHLKGAEFQADLILMRDVIEHIHDQERFMGFLKQFIKSGGRVFFGFPPWYNPFGGHQQICKNRLLSKLPYFHLFPRFIYKGILTLFGESQGTKGSLLEIKETGLSIERFERILKKEHYRKLSVIHYLVNPNYEIKFGLRPRKLCKVLSTVPFLRDFFTTCSYYLVTLDQ